MDASLRLGGRGARAIGRGPNSHSKTTTFLAGLTYQGLIAPFVLDRTINAKCFLAYIEQVLVPTLHEGDTVILNTALTHRLMWASEE
ncbi:transposase [Bradyrhizobium sp. 144]|nr:transposase [Bradyrhizobium sp. 144]